MLESAYNFLKATGAAYYTYQKYIAGSNKDSVLAIQSITPDLERKLNSYTQAHKNNELQISDETLQKLSHEYDGRWARITSKIYDPSCQATKVLREKMNTLKPNQRPAYALEYMQKEANWEKGFCHLLWHHLLIEDDLFSQPALINDKSDNNQATAIQAAGRNSIAGFTQFWGENPRESDKPKIQINLDTSSSSEDDTSLKLSR